MKLLKQLWKAALIAGLSQPLALRWQPSHSSC